VTLGERADGVHGGLIHADGDELHEVLAGLVEHAERPVAGVNEVGRRLGDATQHDRQAEVGSHRADGVEEPLQLGRVSSVTVVNPLARRVVSSVRHVVHDSMLRGPQPSSSLSRAAAGWLWGGSRLTW
jgi:hypothetical protein